LSSISVLSKPTKTTYEIGEALNTSGLKIKATYSDGSTETITSGFTTSGFSSTSAGTKTVTVTYSGKTATFTVTVNAAKPDTPAVGDKPTIVVESVSGKPGQTVTVKVSLENNPGICASELTIEYDNNQLELIEANFQGKYASNGTYNLPYAGFFNFENIVEKDFLVLKFKVKSNASNGNAYITIKGEFVDSLLNTVSFQTISGSVSVKSYTPGDINDDGKINIIDVVCLLRCVLKDPLPHNELALDVNRDEKINIIDVVLLLKYVLKYDVEIY